MNLDFFFKKTIKDIPLYVLKNYIDQSSVVQMNNSVLLVNNRKQIRLDCVSCYYKTAEGNTFKQKKNSLYCYNVKKAFDLGLERLNNCSECHKEIIDKNLELIRK